MTASTTKKVLIRRYDRETLAGYVNPTSFLQPEGVELLSDQGHASIIPYLEIKFLAFVRDFDGAAEPERQVFQTRPKMAGLWVNLRFRDGGVLEGIIPNNLMLLETGGFTVIPPDAFGNQQRVWAPRGSLVALEVLGVIGSPLKKRKAKPVPKEQIGLFDE
ncbi:MAG: hypothetical protein NTW28_16095 [Candidatus Solibacter sp.]|nr:hypothetical protein [Candidatus Solibacter sp.]